MAMQDTQEAVNAMTFPNEHELCPLCCANNKVKRLQAALVCIGILNASGKHYDPEIDKAIREVAGTYQQGPST